MNPGDGMLSPWLDSIATNFEFYKFNSLKFSYSSSVSSFTNGAIVLVPEFDPHGYRTTPPTSLQHLLNKEHATTGNVWSDFTMSIPSDKLSKKHVRAEHSVTHTPEHLRQTDIGQLYIALYNVEVNQPYPYGELFIEYDVTLTIPNQSNSNMKYYAYQATLPACGSSGTDRRPLLGDQHVTHTEPVFEAQHINATASGTLGITHYDPGIVGLTSGNNVNPTRFTFQEPFEGLVSFSADVHSGSMPSNALVYSTQTDPNFVYSSSPGNLARVEEITTLATGGTGGSYSYLWNVAAKAGDVLDLFFDGAGTWTFDELIMTMAEFGLGLV